MTELDGMMVGNRENQNPEDDLAENRHNMQGME